MNERILKLKLEVSINKILYKKNIIDKRIYEEASKQIDKQLFKNNS